MGRLLSVISSLTCMGAGIYLLQWDAEGEPTWFEVIGRGMGIYFVGKGLFVARSLYLAERQLEVLEWGLQRQFGQRAPEPDREELEREGPTSRRPIVIGVAFLLVLLVIVVAVSR